MWLILKQCKIIILICWSSFYIEKQKCAICLCFHVKSVIKVNINTKKSNFCLSLRLHFTVVNLSFLVINIFWVTIIVQWGNDMKFVTAARSLLLQKQQLQGHSCYEKSASLKRKCRHCKDILITGCTRSCHLTTFHAASEENLIKMTTYTFQWLPSQHYITAVAKCNISDILLGDMHIKHSFCSWPLKIKLAKQLAFSMN